jgi:hypothetical protein
MTGRRVHGMVQGSSYMEFRKARIPRIPIELLLTLLMMKNKKGICDNFRSQVRWNYKV